MLAWKDPRLSLLLPFWRTVTPIATTIVVVRDPVEVVASLGARGYQVGPVQAASLWLRYLYAATGDDPGHLLVRHNDIFTDLSGTVARLAAHLGLPAPDAASEAAVREHLDTGLRHHDAAGSVPDAGTAVPATENPLLDLAAAVWNGGAVDLDLVPAEVAELLGRGWLRPPMDGELLARARADVVAARETLRKTNRRVAKLEARARCTEPEVVPTDSGSRGDRSRPSIRSSTATSSAKYSHMLAPLVERERPATGFGRRALLVAEAHPLEFGRDEVGGRADVAQRFVVHAARVVVDVVVQHDEEPVAEPFLVGGSRLAAYQPPTMIPSLSFSGGVCLHEVDEHRVGRERAALDVVDHARLRAVDRIAERRDEADVGERSLDALGDDVGVVAPEHVAGRRLADDRLAGPALELLPVPVGALVVVAGAGC